MKCSVYVLVAKPGPDLLRVRAIYFHRSTPPRILALNELFIAEGISRVRPTAGGTRAVDMGGKHLDLPDHGSQLNLGAVRRHCTTIFRIQNCKGWQQSLRCKVCSKCCQSCKANEYFSLLRYLPEGKVIRMIVFFVWFLSVIAFLFCK